MSEFQLSGDVVVDICRLQARAVMRLGKVRAKTDRQQEMIDDAMEYLRMAGDLMRDWEDQRMDEAADDAAIEAMVERHVERILAFREEPA